MTASSQQCNCSASNIAWMRRSPRSDSKAQVVVRECCWWWGLFGPDKLEASNLCIARGSNNCTGAYDSGKVLNQHHYRQRRFTCTLQGIHWSWQGWQNNNRQAAMKKMWKQQTLWCLSVIQAKQQLQTVALYLTHHLKIAVVSCSSWNDSCSVCQI